MDQIWDLLFTLDKKIKGLNQGKKRRPTQKKGEEIKSLCLELVRSRGKKTEKRKWLSIHAGGNAFVFRYPSIILVCKIMAFQEIISSCFLIIYLCLFVIAHHLNIFRRTVMYFIYIPENKIHVSYASKIGKEVI